MLRLDEPMEFRRFVEGEMRPVSKGLSVPRFTFVDLFCGGGLGARGAVMAGGQPLLAVDAWDQAAETYRENFPEARVLCQRLEEVSPLAELEGKQVDLLLSSPECTNHSPAKGAAPRCEVSRATSLITLDWARALKPRWIVLENVPNMRRWHRFEELVGGVEELGYAVSRQVLNAADFGVAQNRRRLFLICAKDGYLPQIEPPRLARPTVRDILDPPGTWRTSPLFASNRAAPTLARAKRAMSILGEDAQFLIVYYGSDGAGGWQRLDEPLRTVTTLDRFALVTPSPEGHRMRMLQPSEIARAMGLPATHRFEKGSRRDRIRLCGNGICAPVMTHILDSLIGRGAE